MTDTNFSLSEAEKLELEHKARKACSLLTTLETHSNEFQKHAQIAETIGKRAISEVSEDIAEISKLCRAPIKDGRSFEDLLDDLTVYAQNPQQFEENPSLLSVIMRQLDILKQRRFEIDRRLDIFAPKVKTLQNYIHLLITLDRSLNNWISEHPGSHREPILMDKVLYAVRQSTQSLQSSLAVSQQNISASMIVVQNFDEIIRSLERLTTITVSAKNVSETVNTVLSEGFQQALDNLRSLK